MYRKDRMSRVDAVVVSAICWRSWNVSLADRRERLLYTYFVAFGSLLSLCLDVSEVFHYHYFA